MEVGGMSALSELVTLVRPDRDVSPSNRYRALASDEPHPGSDAQATRHATKVAEKLDGFMYNKDGSVTLETVGGNISVSA